MLRFLKISVILLFVLFLISTVVAATDINMNLTSQENTTDLNTIDSNTTESGTDDNEALDNANTIETDDISDPIVDSLGGTAAPSGVSSIAQENMSFSNILNILVITVGVVLILLVIAILIRLKG